MTNADKAELRRRCKADDSHSDEWIARSCDCTVATVKKYSRVFGRTLRPEPRQPILALEEVLSAEK